MLSSMSSEFKARFSFFFSLRSVAVDFGLLTEKLPSLPTRPDKNDEVLTRTFDRVHSMNRIAHGH